ncbi:hypothetical protein TNCV_3256761 [Trichonephila clavipes]|nr:hypothetical protein TNCV_3256761 [Trichonephila clavipes]
MESYIFSYRTEGSIYHVDNVQTVVRIQIVLRSVTNFLQDRQNGSTKEQVVNDQFCVWTVTKLQGRFSIFMDLHPSREVGPESGEGIR